VTLKFSILGGSSAEEPSQRGAAQLLATSALSGTSKRSGIRLCRDLENLGAKIESSADREKVQSVYKPDPTFSELRLTLMFPYR
jgi:predicted Zn-dependent peptidase